MGTSACFRKARLRRSPSGRSRGSPTRGCATLLPRLAGDRRPRRQGGERDSITDIAAALSYYAFLAIPAVLLVAVGIFAQIAGPDTIESMLARLDGVVPAEAIQLIRESLTRVTENQSGGVVLIVLGLGLALWTASGAMNALMRGLNRVYDREETRGFVKQRLTALGMLASLLSLSRSRSGFSCSGRTSATGSGAPSTRGRLRLDLVDGAMADPRLRPARRVRRRPVPRPERRPAALALPHARVDRRGRRLARRLRALRRLRQRLRLLQQGWGSLAAVIILLTWLWLSALALLLGAEVNAEAEREPGAPAGRAGRVELQAPAKT